MDFLNYFSRNQHIRNYKKRYPDFKEENHCRPVLSTLTVVFNKVNLTFAELSNDMTMETI